jgi:hypothetical protein
MRTKRHWSYGRRIVSVIMGIGLGVAGVSGSAAANQVFSWDPAAVVGSAGSAFTADGIQATHYLYDISPTANPSPVIYTVNFLEQITGFTSGGVPISAPGLNRTPGAVGSYGLYLTMQTQTEAVGPPVGNKYLSGLIALMLDPGNNDGAASSTPTGLTFANTGSTGTADDITLATGTLVSAHITLNPAPGIRSIGDFLLTFQPTADADGFFSTPVSQHDEIEVVATTPTTALKIYPDPDGDPNFQAGVLNGGSTSISFQVPEPASILLLGCGLVGLAAVRRRRNVGQTA